MAKQDSNRNQINILKQIIQTNIFFLIGVGSLLLSFERLLTQEIIQEAFNRFQITSTYRLNSAGSKRLTLEDISGDITLKSDDQKFLLIEEVVFINAVSEINALNSYLDAKIILESEGNTVRLTGHTYSNKIREVYLRITVPASPPTGHFSYIRADLTTGNITASKLSGELFLTTQNGNITLNQIRGRTIVSSLVGNTTCSQIFGNTTLVAGAGNINAETISGDVDISCDSGIVEIRAIEGDITYTGGNGNITISDVTGRTVSVHTLKGEIIIENLVADCFAKSLLGDIQAADVDGNLDLFSSNGDINLNNITGDILCWTRNGSIIGQQLWGCVNLQTSAGDILLNKSWDGTTSGQTIDAITEAGNIFLKLPRKFPADFQVEINHPEGRPFQAIVSDFPLYLEASSITTTGIGTTSDNPIAVNLSSSFGRVDIRWSENNILPATP